LQQRYFPLAIEHYIERPVGIAWITVLAGFDESLSLAHYLAFDEDNQQFFRSWIKEVAWPRISPDR